MTPRGYISLLHANVLTLENNFLIVANEGPLQCSFLESLEQAFIVMVIASQHIHIHSTGHSGHPSKKGVISVINYKDGRTLPCTSTKASNKGTILSHSIHVFYLY